MSDTTRPKPDDQPAPVEHGQQRPAEVDGTNTSGPHGDVVNRGEAGTNYPNGVGDHPDDSPTSDDASVTDSRRGKAGTNYPNGVGDSPDHTSTSDR